MANEQTLLKEAIEKQHLDSFLAMVLEIIGGDPFGVDSNAAPSIVASRSNRSQADCSIALTSLAGRGLINEIQYDSRSRLIANYGALKLTEEVKQGLLLRASHYEVLGAPHSPKAMATLEAFFRTERNPIYLGLEVTSHKVFRELENRANAKLQTIFLIPPKKYLSSQRHHHYDEVLNEWIKFIQNGPAEFREFIKIRITAKAYPHLYTSSIGPESTRFDVYLLNNKDRSTRYGEIVV